MTPEPARPDLPDRIPYGRGAVADTCTRIVDDIEGDAGADSLYELEHQLRDWYFDSRADGFPTRASGAEPGGGPGNITHDFDNPDGSIERLEVPQHSDPTGELVAGRGHDPKLRALSEAWAQLQAGAAEIRKARNTLRRALHPPETLDGIHEDARSGEWCWSCLRLTVVPGKPDPAKPGAPIDSPHRVHSPTYRKVQVGADRMPLCRQCADWFYANEELPPLEVIGVWARNERLTSSVLASIERPVPPVRKSKKKRRR